MKLFLCILMILPLYAFGHGESGSARVGKGMAVEKADEHEGIKLTELAIKTTGITTADPAALKELPASSIVASLENRYFYILRDGWFMRRDLPEGTVRMESLGLKPQDRLVVTGAPILRSTELEVFSSAEAEEEEGHEEGEEHGHDH